MTPHGPRLVSLPYRAVLFEIRIYRAARQHLAARSGIATVNR